MRDDRDVLSSVKLDISSCSGGSLLTSRIYCDIANGAADLEAATDYILATRGVRSFLTYGISSGALRAALFAQAHPERVARLALDAFVWTGAGAPTLEQRRKKLPEFLASKRRPIDRAFVRSIFSRDHPDCADERTVEAFADAILALDSSMPNGTYIDMCSRLPVVDPAKITVPTLVVVGDEDVLTPVREYELMHAGIRGSQLEVIAGAGHLANIERPAAVNHLLGEFAPASTESGGDAVSNAGLTSASSPRWWFGSFVGLAVGCPSDGGGGGGEAGTSGGIDSLDGSGSSSSGAAVDTTAAIDGSSSGGGDGPCETLLCGEPVMCCAADQDCAAGACVPACPSGVRCGADAGVCCDAGDVCVSDACVTPTGSCLDSFDCELGEFCEPTLGQCLPQFDPVTTSGATAWQKAVRWTTRSFLEKREF